MLWFVFVIVIDGGWLLLPIVNSFLPSFLSPPFPFPLQKDLSKKKDSKLSIAVSEITGVYAVGTGPRRLGDGLRSFAGYHFFKVI